MSETLHFQVQSPENMVRMLCTILFEQDKENSWMLPLWHKAFDDPSKGDQLFLKFMKELYPNGCTFDRHQLETVMKRAIKFIREDKDLLEDKAQQDKKLYNAWVYFAPDHRVYPCTFGEHMDIVIQCLSDFFQKTLDEMTTEELKHFIAEAFEVKSSITTIQSLIDEVEALHIMARRKYKQSQQRF